MVPRALAMVFGYTFAVADIKSLMLNVRPLRLGMTPIFLFPSCRSSDWLKKFINM